MQMKKALLASAAVAALGFAGLAQAAVIATVTQVTPSPNAFTGPGATQVAPGFTGFVVTLVSDVPTEKIQSFDFSVANGFTGPMHQRWNDPDGGGAFVPSPGSTSQTSVDSHFLQNSATWVVPSGSGALSEDNSGVGSPAPSDGANNKYGLGTFLKGAAGIDGTAQSTTQPLAYIVIPNNGVVNFTGLVSTGQANPYVVSGVIAVPEPATASLLGLGALGLIARRRRA